jgi:hypothetical protein
VITVRETATQPFRQHTKPNSGNRRWYTLLIALVHFQGAIDTLER